MKFFTLLDLYYAYYYCIEDWNSTLNQNAIDFNISFEQDIN